MTEENIQLNKVKWDNVSGQKFKELYYSTDGGSNWKHYSQHPLKKPEHDNNHSKGWATFQYLFKLGFTY